MSVVSMVSTSVGVHLKDDEHKHSHKCQLSLIETAPQTKKIIHIHTILIIVNIIINNNIKITQMLRNLK